MNIIDFETLLIIIFVLVDDCYQRQKQEPKHKSPGVKSCMSDSEILTLALMMDYIPFPGETQFLAFIRANYHQWFPHLLTQSQFNPERFLNKKIEGLNTHIAAKIASHTLRLLLRSQFGIDVLRFQSSSII